MRTDDLTIAPLDAEHWDDLETLFGPERGAYSRCWCMWWRVSGREFETMGGDRRKAAWRERACQAPPAGLLAYREGVPIGWVAVAPRTEYSRLNRSPLLKAVDAAPVWSITCFYIAREHRRTGVARRLIDAAVELARQHGATAVEAYPVDVDHDAAPVDVFTGTTRLFAGTGFTEVARRRPHRPILRRETGATAGAAE